MVGSEPVVELQEYSPESAVEVLGRSVVPYGLCTMYRVSIWVVIASRTMSQTQR